MIVTFEGRDYSLDSDAITIDEYREFKRKYGLTILGFQNALIEADPDALTCAYWVMLRQNGQQNQVLGDQLKFDAPAFYTAVAEAQKQEAAEPAEAEPDPTQGSPSTPESASPPEPPAPDPAQNGQPEAPITVS